jgi:PTS system nitrogen regulatory IIA component
MSLISPLLPVTRVIADLDVASKKRVFEHAGLLYENTLGLPRRLVYDSLFARERLGSTGLGHGVAVPHGRVKGLKEAAAAFIRTKQPIAFEAPDGNPVSLIFILLFPDKATDVHLQIYSELAEMVSDRDLRKTLAEAPDAESIHSTITRWQPHAPGQHRAAV